MISEVVLDGKGGIMGESVNDSFVVDVGVNGVVGEWFTLLLKKARGSLE